MFLFLLLISNYGAKVDKFIKIPINDDDFSLFIQYLMINDE